MERIGREVERELGRGGSSDALPLAALTAAWPEVVGDAVARNAWPLRISKDGTLHVATASATWAHELAFLVDEILERLRARLGADAPTKDEVRGRPGPGPRACARGGTGANSGGGRHAGRGSFRGCCRSLGDQ